MRKLILLLIVLSFVVRTEAKVRLPKLVSDNMVLQRGQPLKIWGEANPQEAVTVTFLKKKYKTVASEDGKWSIELPAMKAGGPYTMAINEITLKNILIGDVWLCSGQSNMELQISRVMDMFAEEVESYENPKIRYIKIPLVYNFNGPQKDLPYGEWKELNQQNVKQYAAFCYFYAKYMYGKTKVPQGIINSSVGGSPIEAWISEESLKNYPEYISEKKICESDEYISAIRAYERKGQQLWSERLFATDPGLRGDVKWYDPNFDDSAWTKVDLLSHRWKCNGVTDAEDKLEYESVSPRWDGVSTRIGSHWFRRTFNVPENVAGQSAVIRMGCIVDADSVYVNGQFVGTVSYQYPPRIYNIPAGLLKAGKNQVTVRLISNGEYPQFVADKPYKVIVGNEEIDLKGEWNYQQGAKMPRPVGSTFFQYKPIGLYNAMIAPLLDYNVKGAIWYQGESNVGSPFYGDLLETMVADWRARFHKPNLPFVVVQLPNFLEPQGGLAESAWAELREQQLKAVQNTPHTALAVAIDLGEWNDIHPLNKKPLGERVALQMQKLLNPKSSAVTEGPVYESCSKSTIDGANRLVLKFRAGTDDLLPVAELKGFAVAGADGVFRHAKAEIVGKTVVVYSDEVPDPVMIRYAWDNNPETANLMNTAKLPASPFRTDK